MVVLFLPYGIGDALMAVPAIRRLVAVRGAENVCVVVRGKIQRQFLQLLVDPALIVIERDDGKPRAQLRLWWRLARLRPEFIATPMLSQRRWRLSYFALLFARTLVPSDFIARGVLRVKPSSTCLEDYEGHQANYLVQFIAELEPRLDRSPVQADEWPSMTSQGQSEPAQAGAPARIAIGISCGELERHKIPSPEWVADLINCLAKEHAIELLIPASRADQPLIDRLTQRLDSAVHANVLIDLPVEQLLTQLQSCSLGISGTTGQGHMMAVAKLPMLVLAGVTNPYESGPYVRRAMVLRHHFACGPCYQKYYVKGCGKIACMETLDLADGARKAGELLTNPKAGTGWLTQVRKPLSVPVAKIEALHQRPLSEWTKTEHLP